MIRYRLVEVHSNPPASDITASWSRALKFGAIILVYFRQVLHSWLVLALVCPLQCPWVTLCPVRGTLRMCCPPVLLWCHSHGTPCSLVNKRMIPSSGSAIQDTLEVLGSLEGKQNFSQMSEIQKIFSSMFSILCSVCDDIFGSNQLFVLHLTLE